MDLYDITVIGAGPAGLFATFYAGLRQMKVKLIDALEEVGGQVAVLYPEKYIYDVPGFRKILAKDLVKNMTEQAFQFNPTLALGERVLSIRKVDGGVFQIDTDKAKSHYSKTVLVTAGVRAFSPNKLDAPGVSEYEGKGIFYFVKERELFKDKRLLIVGGGDSAVDWALNFNGWAKRVTLIHRRDVFRAHEESVAEMMKCGAEVKLFYEVKEVAGDGKWVKRAVIYDNRTMKETALDVDSILVNIGFRADLGPIRNWGLEISGREVKTNGRLETNIPGVYVAGDLAGQVDSVKLNLIATGYAQAAVAVNIAKNFIDPNARIFPGHSSEMSI